MKPTLEDSWREISPYLDEALGLDSSARESWLAELEKRAPQVAPRVRSCLRQITELEEQSFLEGAITLPAPAGLEGHRFGAYTLDRPLGFGGMGTVWLAHRSDGRFEGQVAVKLLNPAFVGHPSERRFEREGSVLARLQHPNIARLLDAGVEAERQPYLVLEYVRGVHIDDYCQRRELDIEQRVRLFLDVLTAVAHAHSNLVVHRDLKPSNILVTANGEVKLLDFGIAALISREGTEDAAALTGHVGPELTPGYASPEQLLGNPITTATDVFALGTVLFELLAGRRPLVGEGEPRTPVELIRLTLEKDAPRLSDVAVEAEWRQTLRGDLDNIVAKALRRSPGERYRGAELFAQDLRCYLAHEPVTARSQSLGYRAAKFVRRHRAVVASACAVAVALVAAGAFSLWQMMEANKQRGLAEDQASRAEFARDFVEFVLTDAGSTGRPFTTSELLGRAEQAVEYGDGDTPAAIEQFIKLGMLFARLGQDRKALQLFEKAHSRAIAGNYAELRRQSACQLGRLYHYAGRLNDATAVLDGAIAELEHETPDSPALIECLEQKSDLELSRHQIASAIAAGQRSLAHARRLFPRARFHEISPRVQLATAYSAGGEFQRAEQLYRDTEDLLKDLGRARTADAVLIYNNWGVLRSDDGDILGAVRLIESGFGIGRALWVDSAPEQFASISYARRLVLLSRFDEAERYLSDALRMADLEDDAEMATDALLGLLAINRERGDFDAARALRDRARQFIDSHMAPEHAARAKLLFESSLLDLAAHSLNDAKSGLQQTIVYYHRVNMHVQNEIVAMAALARCELALGERDQAVQSATDASALATKVAVPGQPSYWLGVALMTQADVEHALGHAGPARELSTRALSQLAPAVGPDHPLTKKAAALAQMSSLPAGIR